ncbi:MAG: class I SAM-dependent methyltransferase [Acidimicrobiales bacterium]
MKGPAAAAVLRAVDGTTIALPVERWRAEPASEEMDVLARAVAPVLDIGCGPGRHVLALARLGVVAMGVDASPAAVDLARSTGAPVLRRSVFARVPGAGRWRTALLLDGNIGIGGDPVTLLRRLVSLLAPGGLALVELEPPGAVTRVLRTRLERGVAAGPWFRWSQVGVDDIDDLATLAGFVATSTWEAGGRWFAQLQRR